MPTDDKWVQEILSFFYPDHEPGTRLDSFHRSLAAILLESYWRRIGYPAMKSDLATGLHGTAWLFSPAVRNGWRAMPRGFRVMEHRLKTARKYRVLYEIYRGERRLDAGTRPIGV